MTCIDRSQLLLIAAMTIALTLTGAEARGFGGGFHGGAGTRVGAWGRPLGSVRPGPAIVARRPGFGFRRPGHYRPWCGGPYSYGLAGLGFGFGSLWGELSDPFYDDAYVYAPRIYRPPVYVALGVETEELADLAAVAACAHRFKTSDPATQTFIGKRRIRRHCP